MRRLILLSVAAVSVVAVVAVIAPRPAILAYLRVAVPERSVQARGPFGPLLASTISRSAQEDREAALGEALFLDTRLSGDGKRACATCHDVATNGASARTRDLTPEGRALPVNTPTVFNAAANFRLNWSGNALTLEDQARASIHNPLIMNSNLTQVARRLAADKPTADRFRTAFGRGPDEAGILRALTRYETTLTTPRSRFDRYLLGDRAALSADEMRGYRLFQSAGCSSCHQGVNVGGNLFQRSGVFHPIADAGSPVLRVPSLRNVATTAPYFHDGSAKSLEDAVHAMGRAQLNRVLTPAQVGDIAAFLRTLTGEYRDRQVTATRP